MLSFLEMSVSPPKLHVITTKEFKGKKKKVAYWANSECLGWCLASKS